LPPSGQLSSSHCGFNDGNCIETEVGCTASSTVQSRLAASDYHFFGPMKGFLEGKRFRNNDEVIAAVQYWIHEQPKTFFETGIKKLPEYWHKCMSVKGDYIEKLCVKLFHFIVNKFFRYIFSFQFERP
jgi:hypothetical protein